MEKIFKSAIKQSNKVYVGKRHSDVIRIMVKDGFSIPIKGIQGFVTEDGKFLNREESAKVALKNKQIKKLKFSKTKLYSEDLY